MNLRQQEQKLFFHTYSRLPIEIERGEGVYLFDSKGNKYLDMFAGLAVNALGYSHPGVIKAITEQSRNYIHISNYYLQKPQIQLADILIQTSKYKKIFLCNSGTEGIEGALKIARRWGKQHNKHEIISFTNAYHGRTFGALSLMDRNKHREGYDPFLSDCKVVQYNNAADLRKLTDESTAAVFIECIQGEAGVIPAEPAFIEEIQKLRERYNFLVVADEIQSGLGRTGKLFSFEHYSFIPDISVVAKALGGGLPLGAVMGNDRIADIFQPGTHGSTFGGNPVACAAGIVVLNELLNKGVIENAAAMGKILYSDMNELKNRYPDIIKEVRGKGLMLGLELSRGCSLIRDALLKKNIIVNCTGNNVLRLLPPLIITEEHVSGFKLILDSVLKSFAQQ